MRGRDDVPGQSVVPRRRARRRSRRSGPRARLPGGSTGGCLAHSRGGGPQPLARLRCPGPSAPGPVSAQQCPSRFGREALALAARVEVPADPDLAGGPVGVLQRRQQHGADGTVRLPVAAEREECPQAVRQRQPGRPLLMRSVGSASGRLDCSSGRLVSTRPLRLLWKPIGRSCARRFAGGWTADGMPCPVLAGALDH